MFKCHICGSDFSTKTYLGVHIMKVHEGIKQRWKCEICVGNLRFPKREELGPVHLHFQYFYS